MDFRFAKSQRSAGPSTQAVALFACLIVILLGCWRGTSLFTQPVDEWVPGSDVEASLMGILEPVAGMGNIRLSVTGKGTSHSVLILLATRASEAAPTLERLTTSALMMNPEEGDQLVIEQAAFARGVPGRPSAAGWTELGLYGALLAMLAWIGLKPSDVPAADAKRARTAEPVEAALEPALVEKRVKAKPALTAEPGAAAKLVQKDPARTASILRSWMHGEGGSA
ncbi:hypothetical protein HY29_12535 [Hyphomonas beringensis]|uniref:Flagellar M-ring C-terminal domain-containing protein n=1 Tax=Hyphomonas beringensis TaxID=1280946 RepID=A0A062U4U0_9PROT|nr:hypothetical protein [Hyphomonas beringensis]KCZ55356.1 hypothetical protein HY29_12535 [Hyphomonas beringensis]